MIYSLSLQIMVVLPPNFLDSDASIWYVHLVHASTTKHHSSHVIGEPTLTSNTRGGDLGTRIFLDPRGLETNGTQTLLLAKFKDLFYQNKILLVGLCGHNAYICTL